MREFTLLETGYLSAGLLLSLVLPMLMNLCGPPNATARKSCLKTVWTGQILLALAGLTVLASPLFAAYAAGFGLASCMACAFRLLRQFRAMSTAHTPRVALTD